MNRRFAGTCSGFGEVGAAGAWARALEAGSAPPLEMRPGRRFTHGAEALAAGRLGDDFLRSGHTFGGRIHASARLTRHLTGGLELPVREVRGEAPHPELHVTAAWAGAGAALTLGRTRPRLGPGADDLLLAGTLPLTGARLSSAAPFRLPGVLSGLGNWSTSPLLARPGGRSRR